MSTILHGRPLITTCPFFLSAEHCILYQRVNTPTLPFMPRTSACTCRTHGKVVEAPAPVASNVSWCSSSAISASARKASQYGKSLIADRRSMSERTDGFSEGRGGK